MIRYLKLRPFFCIFRPLSPPDLEAILQSWTAGKDAGIWISIDIVIAFNPSLNSHDFDAYMKLGYGQDALYRGFFAHKNRRKVEAIFLFDRVNAQIAYKQGCQVS